MQRVRFALLFLVLSLTPGLASAGESTSRHSFGSKFGFLTPGTVTVDNDAEARDFDADSGLILGAFYDHAVSERFSLGAAIDVLSFSAAADDAVKRADIGLTAKTRLGGEASAWTFRPGLLCAVGLASIEEDTIRGWVTEETATFFVYDIFVEALYQKYVFDIGYTGASGGTEDEWVTFWNQWFVRGGLTF